MYREYERMAREFPDYDQSLLPVGIPADWADNSWHNDACPSFLAPVGSGHLAIYVDYFGPAARESASAARYGVMYYPPDWMAHADVCYLYEGDDFGECVRHVHGFQRGFWRAAKLTRRG